MANLPEINAAGYAALAICESLLLALTDLKIAHPRGEKFAAALTAARRSRRIVRLRA